MRIDVVRREAVFVDAVRISAPIRYDDDKAELVAQGLPGADEGRIELTIGLDDGVVRGWPAGKRVEIHTKVCDEGTYELLAVGGRHIVATRNGYVPGFLPGEHFGDYLILTISEAGVVEGWRPKVSELEAFARGDLGA